MQRKVDRDSLLYGISIFFLAFIMTASICDAQNIRRKDKSEIFGLIQQMSGDTTTGLGITMEVESFTGFGFGAGYNLNENFNINLDMFFSSTDINVVGTPVTGDTSIFGWDVNLDFNILKNQITPLVTGGLGFINFSGDFQGIDFDETDFSYNLGAGLRWDVTENFLIKGLYRATWTKLEDTDEEIMLDGISVSLGYKF